MTESPREYATKRLEETASKMKASDERIQWAIDFFGRKINEVELNNKSQEENDNE